jgi:ketosteroid isomerase-like protein
MKKSFIYFLTTSFAGILAIGCTGNNAASGVSGKDSATSFDLATVKKIIEEKNKQFTQAHITRDTAFLNNIFTKDAKVFAPNTDVVTGHKAIAALNVDWVNYGIKTFNEESTAFYGGPEYIIDEGNYDCTYGKNTFEKGKYLDVWKKEGGEWKLFTNIWNTNTPEIASK